MGIISDIEGLKPGSNKKILVECDFKTSPKCRGTYESILNNINRSKNGQIIKCEFCSKGTNNYTYNPRSGAKYHYDCSVMNNIDTTEKAYLLGWLATDGCISTYDVRISLNAADAQVITNMFVSVLGNNIPPLRYKSYPPRKILSNSHTSPEVHAALIKIGSKEIADACRTHLNLTTTSKTYTVQMPTFVNNELTWAFLRGVFEGDGTLTGLYTIKAKNSPGSAGVVSICSASPNFIKGIVEWLSKHDIVCSVHTANSVERIEIINGGSIPFLKYIYPMEILETQLLERKYKTAIEWIKRSDEIDRMAIEEFGGNRYRALVAFNRQYKLNNQESKTI